MPLKLLGAVMMADGALVAYAVSSVLATFWDRDLRDRTLVVGHAVVGLWLFVAGRLLWASTPRGVRLAGAPLLAVLALAAAETTRFNWPWTAGRAAYVAAALGVLVAAARRRSPSADQPGLR